MRRLQLTKKCCYRGKKYNLLPAILVVPLSGGFRVAFKWWNFHFGVQIGY